MEIRRRPPNPKVQVENLEYAIPHKDSEPRNILEKIVWEKEREITLARERVPLSKLIGKIEKIKQPKAFLGALKDSVHSISYSDWLLLFVSVLVTLIMLFSIVRLLKSMVLSKVEAFFDKYIFTTAIRAMTFGFFLTILVDSTSVFFCP